MDKGPIVIARDCISEAWQAVMKELLFPAVVRLTHLTVSINITEDEILRNLETQRLLDSELLDRDLYTSDTTANTIFPKSLWNQAVPRFRLFERYRGVVPILKKLDGRNRYGTYFERLVDYHNSKDPLVAPINQLEHVIQTFRMGNRRRSALQAAIYNPVLDQNHQRRRGFPCLQYVTFDPDPSGELRITGVYTTQYIFDRGLGNYLGLYYLGLFMAHEMSLQLSKVIIVTMRAERGNINKVDGRVLLDKFLHKAS